MGGKEETSSQNKAASQHEADYPLNEFASQDEAVPHDRTASNDQATSKDETVL